MVPYLMTTDAARVKRRKVLTKRPVKLLWIRKRAARPASLNTLPMGNNLFPSLNLGKVCRVARLNFSRGVLVQPCLGLGH